MKKAKTVVQADIDAAAIMKKEKRRSILKEKYYKAGR